MYYRHIGFALVLSAILFTGCKKDSTDPQCQQLENAMAANDKNTVTTILTQFINQLPSDNYSQQNLDAFATSLSGQCTVSAQVLCFDCIQTLPAQSEIRLSFISSESQVDKSIDISHLPGDTKMKVLNMHE